MKKKLAKNLTRKNYRFGNSHTNSSKHMDSWPTDHIVKKKERLFSDLDKSVLTPLKTTNREKKNHEYEKMQYHFGKQVSTGKCLISI